MKVLFVHNFLHTDYQTDGLYYGLLESGCEVYETHFPGYMLATYDKLNSLSSKGFTLYGKLNHVPRVDSQQTIIEKIKSNFYDLVIYGNIYSTWWLRDRSCFDYFEYVKKYYSKNKVHFIDGADYIYSPGVVLGLQTLGTIWKSSSVGEYEQPINFAIPEAQIIKTQPIKEKLFSNIVPSKTETYIYDNEKDYYNDYASSYYGFTWKKAQWWCLRHLEVLANRCIPYFPGLEKCPENIMTTFPKNIILETNCFAKKSKVHPCYNEISEILLHHTKENLTTKKLAETVINFVKKDTTYFLGSFLADCPEKASPTMPHVTIVGDEKGHEYTEKVIASFQAVYFNSQYTWRNQTLIVKLAEWVKNFDDQCSGKYFRCFLNTLISCINTPRYLEIDVGSGSTIFSAMSQNIVDVTAITNWKDTPDIKTWFHKNITGVVTYNNSIEILDHSPSQIDFTKLTKHNVYFYNEKDYNKFLLPFEALADTFILLVSDWNFLPRRNCVYNDLKKQNIKTLYSISIKTSNNNNYVPEEFLGYKHNWHNGYYIAVCQKQ